MLNRTYKVRMASSTLMVYAFVMVQPTQTDPQFKLRFPVDLKMRVEHAAAENNRSMNAEIVAALEEKFPPLMPGSAKTIEGRVLLWLAGRIRRRRPEPGSARDRQASAYEALAARAELRGENE